MLKKFHPHRTTELWLYNTDSTTITVYSDRNLRLTDFYLNEVGSFIWKHCNGELSNEEITEKLFDELEGEKPALLELQIEVDNYMQKLYDEGLLYWEKTGLDVLLVTPPFPKAYSKTSIKYPESSSPPLGLAYIATVLQNNDYAVDILDMHIQALNPEDIIEYYIDKKPKIVGLSATTPTFPNAVRIAKLLKAWDKDVIIVIGGVHATCASEECAELDCIDYVVNGEGEFTMLELTNHLIHNIGEISEIDGLIYKQNDVIKYNKQRVRLKDLDSLPFPARNLIDITKYHQKGSIISSRGCPYHCNYCSCGVMAGHTYRIHSVDYVLNEIEYIIENYGINNFDFHDDTFNFYPQRVLEFCKKIKTRNLKFTWGCFCRVTNFTYDIAYSMKEAGCKVIQFGVESGCQTILNSIHKQIYLTEIEDAVISAQKAGIEKIACGFIIGHANDTEETINETIEFGLKLANLGVTDLALSVLTPYPGTEVYNELDKIGIRLLTKEWENFIFSKVVIETKNITKERLQQLYVYGVDKFRKTLAVNYANSKVQCSSINGVILLAHPNINNSKANKFLIENLASLHQVKIIDLYSTSMNVEYYIDILKDAKFIVLQFPLYWGAAPSKLKEWIDGIFTVLALKYKPLLYGKSILVVTTTAAEEDSYQHNGLNKHTVDEFLYQYELMSISSGMIWQRPLVIYGMEGSSVKQRLQKGITKYNQSLEAMLK